MTPLEDFRDRLADLRRRCDRGRARGVAVCLLAGIWAAGVRWRVEAVRPVDRHTIEVDLAGDNGRTLARRLARDRPVGYTLDT